MDDLRVAFPFTKKETSTRQGQYLFLLIKKYRKVIYCCNQKYSKNNPHHHTPNFSLDDIQQMFLQALNSLLDEKKETRENLTKLMKKVCRTTALEKELEGLEQELCIVSENLENFVRKHTTTDAEQSEKEEQLQKLCDEKKNSIAELKNCIKEKHNRKYSIQNFIDTLDGLNGKQTEFSEELWGSLLDHILKKYSGQKKKSGVPREFLIRRWR